MTEDMVERTGDVVVLRYERSLAHPIEVVWRAITDMDEIESWSGSRPEIDLRVGGAYITHHATGDRVVDRILRLEPPRLLEQTFWQHLNPDATVTYELQPTHGGTLLALTHRLTTADLERAAETFPEPTNPYDLLARTSAGWPRLLDRLESTLH